MKYYSERKKNATAIIHNIYYYAGFKYNHTEAFNIDK